MTKKNNVAVLTNPAVKRVEYLPTNKLEMKFDDQTVTIEEFYQDYIIACRKIVELENLIEEKDQELKKYQEKQAQINELINNSIKLLNEKLSIVETDIETLNNLK